MLAADAMQRAPRTAAFASASEPKDGDAKTEATAEAETGASESDAEASAEDGSVAELQVCSRSLLESQTPKCLVPHANFRQKPASTLLWYESVTSVKF